MYGLLQIKYLITADCCAYPESFLSRICSHNAAVMSTLFQVLRDFLYVREQLPVKTNQLFPSIDKMQKATNANSIFTF